MHSYIFVVRILSLLFIIYFPTFLGHISASNHDRLEKLRSDAQTCQSLRCHHLLSNMLLCKWHAICISLAFLCFDYAIYAFCVGFKLNFCQVNFLLFLYIWNGAQCHYSMFIYWSFVEVKQGIKFKCCVLWYGRD